MSCSYAKGAWEVRWRDASSRQRSQRFDDERAARAFDDAMRAQSAADRPGRPRGASGGVYPYETDSGTKWRYVVRRSDGSMTSKRGFSSQQAARDARRRLQDRQDRGELRHTKESFGAFWERWLARRKPYLQAGTWLAYERDGRLRLVPALGSIALGRLDVEAVRELMDQMTEAVEAEGLAPKTVNNTLGTLVVCLNAALADGLIASNPAMRVERLPAAHVEREYLRLHEIPLYLGGCKTTSQRAPRSARAISVTSTCS